MRKFIGLFIFILIMGFPLLADPIPLVLKNAVSLNLDSGSIFTYLSLERRIITANKFGIIGQIGIGSIPFIGGFSFPHKIIITLPAQKHVSLEIGAGGNYWMKDIDASLDSYYLYPIFGFRIDSAYNMLFRITFSPYINMYGEDFFSGYDFPPAVAVSTGYLF